MSIMTAAEPTPETHLHPPPQLASNGSPCFEHTRSKTVTLGKPQAS